MHHYIYRIENEETGQYYIGVRSSKCVPEEDTSYWSSSIHSKKFRTGYPWVKSVLQQFSTRKEANAAEVAEIMKYLGDYDCLNRAAVSSSGGTFSDEVREKMSAAKKGKPKSEETKAKMSAWQKGKPKSEETKAKMRAFHQNRSEETKAKMSVAHKGKTLPDETKAKISATQKERLKGPFSDEHRAALRAAHARRKLEKQINAALL